MKKSVLNGTAAAAAALLLSLFTGVNALAAETVYTEGGMHYVIEDNGSITITDYFGSESTVEIPSMIGGYPVSSIIRQVASDSIFAALSNMFSYFVPWEQKRRSFTSSKFSNTKFRIGCIVLSFSKARSVSC